MNEYGLRECPFCGSSDVKDRGRVKGKYRIAFIQCHHCNARSGAYEGMVYESYQALKSEAAAAWNRRRYLKGEPYEQS